MRAIVLAALFLSIPFTPALAWWDEGHMQIAYLAYKQLDPVVKERADALLRLNPDYPFWTAGAPAGAEKAYAFVHAATWPDDIKTKADYYDDQVTDATAKQLVPYGHLKHTTCTSRIRSSRLTARLCRRPIPWMPSCSSRR